MYLKFFGIKNIRIKIEFQNCFIFPLYFLLIIYIFLSLYDRKNIFADSLKKIFSDFFSSSFLWLLCDCVIICKFWIFTVNGTVMGLLSLYEVQKLKLIRRNWKMDNLNILIIILNFRAFSIGCVYKRDQVRSHDC